MRTHHESDSQIGSQRNQLLVQALIANHLQGMQHQRFGSLWFSLIRRSLRTGLRTRLRFVDQSELSMSELK